MALYEYFCRDCDTDTELLVRSPEDEPECPDCGSTRMIKLISVPALPGSRSGPDEPPPGPCGSACGCFPDG